MTATQSAQINEQLSKVSVVLENVKVVRQDASTIDCEGLRFGKYTERFTVALDRKGNVKRNSVRFYGVRDAELN
jgi:hypothetical protein